MKQLFFSAFFVGILFSGINAQAQNKYELTDLDKSSLEGIIVEQYYVAQSKDEKDTVGGVLPKGAVTYRIYVDLKPGYTMQAVFGEFNHELRFATTTEFYNNRFGAATGDNIEVKQLNHHNVELDSWVSIGAATQSHWGIPLTEDKDGSIISKKDLKMADGLFAGAVRPISFIGMDMHFFYDTKKPSLFSTSDAAWAAFGGVKGATEDNKILIAQLTTDGKLSFELNLQVSNAKGGSIQFVARNPEDDEIKFDGLIH
jgi:hypothetical protein